MFFFKNEKEVYHRGMTACRFARRNWGKKEQLKEKRGTEGRRRWNHHPPSKSVRETDRPAGKTGF